MNPETSYARSGDSHIAYQVIGNGPIDMVFMSAWFSHIDGRWEEPAFARMLRRFASFSRLIVFDKRGSGASDPLPRDTDGHSWEDWADDIRAVLDAASSKKAALVGVGDSGPIAMLFAATYPERVSSLVLVNACARLTKDDDYPFGFDTADLEYTRRRMAETWGTGSMLEVFSPSKQGDAAYKNWWAKYQRMSASPGTLKEVAQIIFTMDVRKFLSTIQVPTLVIHRTDMPMVPVEHGRYLAENIPNAKYVEFAGTDYFIYLGDNAAEIHDEIEEFLTGVRHVAEPDRMLATVMFTDIVGSTDRAVEMGDRKWRELLDSHDYLVRRQLDEYRGRLVKTTGDGLLATFDGPARAIRGAWAIQDALQEQVGIEIRSGLHAGEVEVRGEDVGGISVHIGARVMSKAEGGEVLCSSTVKDLVAGSGIHFADRGVHALKGIPEEWRLFAAVKG